MKIIARNNQTYARHWFRWYLLIGATLVERVKAPKEELKDE